MNNEPPRNPIRTLITTSLYFLKRYEKTLLNVTRPTMQPIIKIDITAVSKLFKAFNINSYFDKNTRINEPLMPGRINAEIAIAPDKNIYKFVFGVLEGACSAMYDEIINPIKNEMKTVLLTL